MLGCERLVGLPQRGALSCGIRAAPVGLDQGRILAAHVDQRAQLLLALGRGGGALDLVRNHLVGWSQVLASHHHQLPVLLGQRTLTICGVVRDVGDMLCALGFLVGTLWHQLHGGPQALGHVVWAVHDHARLHARGAMAEVGGSDHVARVRHVVFIDEHLGACRRLVGHRVDPRVRWHHRQRLLALAQDHDVRDNLRSGVLLEGARRQTDRAHQLGLFCQSGANARCLLVHRAVGRDANHQAARAHLIHGFQEKVVVKERAQAVVAAVGNRGVLEWPIADHDIVEVIGRLGLLIPHDLHVRIGVQQLRHGPGQAVQFDAG